MWSAFHNENITTVLQYTKAYHGTEKTICPSNCFWNTVLSPVYAVYRLFFLKAHGTQIFFLSRHTCENMSHFESCSSFISLKVRQRRRCSRKWDINKQQWHTSSIASSHQSSADTSASHTLRVLLMSEATGTSVWNICSGYSFLQNEPLFRDLIQEIKEARSDSGRQMIR